MTITCHVHRLFMFLSNRLACVIYQFCKMLKLFYYLIYRAYYFNLLRGLIGLVEKAHF